MAPTRAPSQHAMYPPLAGLPICSATWLLIWPPDAAPHEVICVHNAIARRPTDVRICRIEGVAPGRIYAQKCIIVHDSASVLTSQRQLLRNLFT